MKNKLGVVGAADRAEKLNHLTDAASNPACGLVRGVEFSATIVDEMVDTIDRISIDDAIETDRKRGRQDGRLSNRTRSRYFITSIDLFCRFSRLKDESLVRAW